MMMLLSVTEATDQKGFLKRRLTDDKEHEIATIKSSLKSFSTKGAFSTTAVSVHLTSSLKNSGPIH